MRKITAALLLVAMLTATGAMTACSTDEKQDETTPTNEVTTTETTSETEADPYAGYDLSGYTLRILNVEGVVWGTPQLDVEEISGNAVDDATYTRNRALEEKLNFTLSVLEENEPHKALEKAVNAGEDLYDVSYTITDQTASNVSKNLYANILDLPSIDLTSPWWDPEFNNGLILRNAYLYQASSSFNVSTFIRSVAVVFNKDILINNGLELPYDMARDGKWTYDVMKTYAETAKNLNGDDKYSQSGNCIYGTATFSGWLSVAATSAGSLVQVDENGEPYFAGASESFVNALDILATVFSGDGMTLDDGSTYVERYAAGKALFMVSAIGNVSSLRDMDSEYGILPAPKYYEEEDYSAPMGSAYVMGIPVTNSHMTETATALDCLSRYSYETVLPVFFDSLCYKGLRDEDSLDMLSIINTYRKADLGRIFGWTQVFLDQVGAKLVTGKLNIMSDIESKRSSIESSITKTMDAIHN